MTRPAEDWTDRRYLPDSELAHLVPFGDAAALCGEDSVPMYGTGCWNEIEKALALPMCPECHRRLPRERGSEVDPAVAVWTQAMDHANTIPPREKGTTC